MYATSFSLRKWPAIARVVLLAGLWIVGRNTVPAQAITFDVASVRPNHSGDVTSGEHTGQGRLTIRNDTLKQLILVAFDVKEFQIKGGPKWLDLKDSGNLSIKKRPVH
jgi:hypothetical protein